MRLTYISFCVLVLQFCDIIAETEVLTFTEEITAIPIIPALNSKRFEFFPKSTEQRSAENGDEEVRRLGSSENSWEPWEGGVEISIMTNSAANVSVTKAEKIEALFGIVSGITIAILTNIFMRYAIHGTPFTFSK